MLSFGVGIRSVHTEDVLAQRHAMPVVEVIAENYLGRGGRMRRVIEAARAHAAVCVHGVSLSLGSVEPLDRAHLRALRTWADEIGALTVSDHLSFTRVDGVSSYDLWPMPFTEDAVAHLAARIRQAQDELGRQLLVENVSSYVRWTRDALSEPAFLNAVCAEAGCGLLLDVNNLFVNSVNHGFDFDSALDAIDLQSVGQVHVAGHRQVGAAGEAWFLLDDHGSAPCERVVEGLARIAPRLPDVPVILEWDEQPPRLDALLPLVGALRARVSPAHVTQGVAA